MHSQWQGTSAPPPQFLTVDMGEVKAFHGMPILPRQGDQSGKPNEVNVQISQDNKTWVDAGNADFQNNKNPQHVFFESGFKACPIY
ncbi:discoidin domain-containing protein [Pedobacter frigidisoli]|uniref:Discoidin domain-containing protein n=1 Tax=Pedobacter frigidisoli TaxID=2530455 RepID=A0A4R0NZF8_9SPHI|nr:discoidin domain-containing protein [Pedobacter frigidisoli]